MIDFDEVAFKLAKAEADNKVLQYKLERTRKALDVALDCLNGVGKELPWVKRTLEKITALEQKDIK